jgi:hypothetical protein
MTENLLLDAVDQLTKPVRQMRIMETDHDHDWLALTITRTHAELKALKAAGEDNPEKTIRTGQWWCPWCDTVVDTPERTVPTTKVVRREDASLLDQLEEAVGNSLENAGNSKPAAERAPADIAALQLSVDIRAELVKWMGDLGAKPGAGLSLSALLRSWYTFQLASVHPEDGKIGTLRWWAGRVKGMLEPTNHSEILHICPSCEFAFVLTADERKRALQGTSAATYEDTSVECLVCGSKWTGWEELHRLANATRRLEGQPERESPPLIA